MPQVNLGNTMGLMRQRNCKEQKLLVRMGKGSGCLQSSQIARGPT